MLRYFGGEIVVICTGDIYIFQKQKKLCPPIIVAFYRIHTKTKSLRSLACCIIFLQFPQTVNIVFGIKKKKNCNKELNLNVFDLELSDEERWRRQRPPGEMYDLPERV